MQPSPLQTMPWHDTHLDPRALARAQSRLYRDHIEQVRRKIHRVVGPDMELDDLVQETFIKAFRALPKFRAECSLTNWVLRIALNVALQHLRTRRRRGRWLSPMGERPIEHSALDEAPGPADHVAQAELLSGLHQVLEGIKPKKRIVYVLYEVEGHTLEEIAELLDCSVNTVASRLRSARAEVRRALKRRFRDVAPLISEGSSP